MEKLKSRKFWMAIVSAVIIVANEGLGWNLPAETIYAFAAVVLGWIITEGAVDMKATQPDIYYEEIYDDDDEDF